MIKRQSLFGTSAQSDAPIEHAIDWMYPSDKSTLLIDICHVRVIDVVRIRFDFDAHQYVAEMEAPGQKDEWEMDEVPEPTKWVEVARWSGDAPEKTL